MTDEPQHKSPEYTITVGEGVQDRIEAWRKEVGALVEDRWTGVKTADDLAERRQENFDLLYGFTNVMHRLFSSTAYDGDKLIYLEGEGLGWTHRKSGLTGGLYRHAAGDPRKTQWSIHT